MLKDRNGFTLIELMVTMGLIGLIGGLGVTVYLQANNTFDRAENKWNIQSDMRRIASFMNKYMKSAYDLKIAPDNIPNELDESEYYFYLKDIDNNKFGSIIYKKKNLEKKIAGDNNSPYEYSINFENEEPKLLNYTITAKNSSYEISSSIYLVNMTRQTEIEILNGSSTDVYFKSSINESGSPSPELSTFCFIATASYGTKTKFPVKVLRIFRDRYLDNFGLGRYLVKQYYKYSPPLATYIANNKFASFLVRISLIPFVLFAYMTIIYKQALLSFSLIFLMILYIKYNNSVKRGEFYEFFIWEK